MSKRILLIEDDTDARLLFKNVLTGEGYSVDAFSEGNTFINVDPTVPDLFIFDNSIPTIDGIALTKYLKIRKQTRHVPVLIMSANQDISAKARKAGASAFIAKPFEVDTFLTTVGQLLSVHEEIGEKSRTVL
ncbi:MAG TPA: response regulator [Ohtaekwangia sp.]